MNIAFTVLSENFKLVTFNCHGLKSSISYVLDLIKRHDVIFICEHWLKVNELNSISDMCGNDYLICFLKSSIDPYNDLRGRSYGGTGFLCKKKSNVAYKIIECNNDILHGLQVLVNQTVALSIIGVYLLFYDSSEGNTELYIDTLVSLQCVLDECDNQAPTIILGDTNTVLPQDEMLTDRWFQKRPYFKWSGMLYDFLNQNEMTVANFMFKQKVSHTYQQGDKQSYIDHMFVPQYFSENIMDCKILSEDLDSMSDHTAVSMAVKVPVIESQSAGSQKKNYKFPHARWADPLFQCHYSHAVSQALEEIPIINIDTVTKTSACETVDVLYNTLCDIMHCCVKACGDKIHKQSLKKKHWWNSKCSAARNRCRLFHYIWKSSGRPKGGKVFECFKDARKTYKRCCRDSVNSNNRKKSNLINKLHREKKFANLWNVIRTSKRCSKPISENIIKIEQFVEHLLNLVQMTVTLK